MVLPTRLMVFSISVVALGGLVFIATQGDDGPDRATPAAVSTASPTPTKGPSLPPQPTPSFTPSFTPSPKPVNKARTDVVVFNNTNIKGLAGKTSGRAQRAGWNVLGTDNWQGTVDASTVYYGPKLKAAAQLLAADLDIARVKPAIEPMNPKNLTVILTDDYQ